MRAKERKINTGAIRLRRNTATTIFLVAVGVLLAYLSYQIARPFLGAVAWAAILAIAFQPVHGRFRLLIRRENASAAASTALTTLVGILPLVMVGLAIVREAAQGYRQVAGEFRRGADPAATVNQLPVLGPALMWVQAQLQQRGIDLDSISSDLIQRVGAWVVGLATGALSNLTSFVLDFVLVIFILFFFFRDGRLILDNLRRIVPLEAEAAERIYLLIGDVVRATITGVVGIALLKGVLVGLAFWVLGIHSPALWGAVGAVASIIPVVGVGLLWVPAAIALWLQGHPAKALLLTVWGATVLSLLDNFLYPLLVGNQVRLHTLLVFISALGGIAVFGFLGFILGPVVATLTIALVEVATEYYSGRAATLAQAAAEVEER